MTERQPRLFYVREYKAKSHKPKTQATVMYRYNDQTGQLRWSAAFCNTKEDQFRKADGRALAQARFAGEKAVVSLLLPGLTDHQVRLHIRRNLSVIKPALDEQSTDYQIVE
jgi:hypothetical protein